MFHCLVQSSTLVNMNVYFYVDMIHFDSRTVKNVATFYIYFQARVILTLDP